jgi:hypothetical protein
MGAISVKAPSTQGTRSRLARAQPRVGTVDQGRFTPRPRVSSSNGCTFDSPEAQLGQASRRSNLDQIATPTDRIAGAINARITWHLILTHAPQSTRPQWPQSHRRTTDWPDRKTTPPALLRLLCHSPEWGRQQLSPASGAIGSSASPDPRARPRLGLGRRSPPRPTPGLGLNLDLGRWTPPRPTLGLRLNLDLGRRTPPRPTPGLGLDLDLGRRSLPRPTPGLGLDLDLGRRSPPRPTPGLGLHIDLGRRSPPRPTPGLGLSLDLGRRTLPRPTPGLRLNLDSGRRSPPRPTPGLGLSLNLGGVTASPDLRLGPTTS